jgi:coenzyme F420-0:L-glutamate ligase/coenzyme F420-1:gamma-L-glutamate ligase
MTLEIIPIRIKHEIEYNMDLVDLVKKSKVEIRDNDILVVTQKIVSKQEGRVIELATVIPSILAQGIASEYQKDSKLVEVILSESKRIVRMKDGIIIVETNHGFVCANAGVDESNVDLGMVTLLPKEPDMSAKRIQDEIKDRFDRNVAVLISDTFGRPFRMGQTDCAIGISGLDSICEYEGKTDSFGRTLRVTAIAIADEMCSAAELVMGKTNGCPMTIIRNYPFNSSNDSIKPLLRSDKDDLFR